MMNDKELLVAKGYLIDTGYIGYLDNQGNQKQLFCTESEYLEYVAECNNDHQ